MRERVEYRLHVNRLCAVPPFRDFRVAIPPAESLRLLVLQQQKGDSPKLWWMEQRKQDPLYARNQ